MRRILLTLVLLATVSSSFAQKTAKKDYLLRGIMQHSDLEGGCWFLQAKNEKYELIGSPEDLRKCYVEGRMVELRVVDRPFMASTCMLGRRVEILEVLDTNFHARDPIIMQHQITGRVRHLKNGCWYVQTKDCLRYELRAPIPKRYRKVGAKFDHLVRFLEGNEGVCGMNGVILFPLPKTGPAKQKTFDPR